MRQPPLLHRHRERDLRRRTGFTLVELLVVITLMVTLGGILTYALASAETEARIKRTQADVVSIGQILQTRMSEVSLGRVELTYAAGSSATAARGGFPFRGVNADDESYVEAQERSRLILLARRDLMRMVLPECRADLLYPPASIQYRTRVGGSWVGRVAQLKPPSQWSRMRTVAGLQSAATLNASALSVTDPTGDGIAAAYDFSQDEFTQPFSAFTSTGTPSVVDTIYDDPMEPDDRVWTREFESAECLYLILATTELFGKPAIDLIQSSNIGDVDGDGFREILDAWGNPYEMIRNPAGLRVAAIKNFDASGNTLVEQYPVDPDPLDFLVSDHRYDIFNFGTPVIGADVHQTYQTYYCPPAVISAGRDGEFGIRRSYWIDEEGLERGVPDYYSSSAVVIGGMDTPTPNLASAIGIVHRFPDPYFDVSTIDMPLLGAGANPVFDIRGILNARIRGLGSPILPGALDYRAASDSDLREQSADNITSLDGDF
ncbi:MAG: type II secretion system protein [Planctomycetota bacterium]